MKESLDWYLSNYELIAAITCSEDIKHKQYIDGNESKPLTCRFCGKKYPDVRFSNTAHAISELVGNKSVLIKSECDNCNKLIGHFEDQFAKFLGPARTVMQTYGKKGIPSYKRDDKKVRIDYKSNICVMQEVSGSNSIIRESDVIHLRLPKSPYVPVDAFKALVAMAISIIPIEEITAFKDTIEWLIDSEECDSLQDICNYSSLVIVRSIEGNKPLPITGVVLRRKPGSAVPYATFKLEFDNCSFQIFIPTPSKDCILSGKKLSIYPMPSIMDNSIYGMYKKSHEIFDLSGTELKKGETFYCDIHFDAHESLNTNYEAMSQMASALGVNTL